MRINYRFGIQFNRTINNCIILNKLKHNLAYKKINPWELMKVIKEVCTFKPSIYLIHKI